MIFSILLRLIRSSVDQTTLRITSVVLCAVLLFSRVSARGEFYEVPNGKAPSHLVPPDGGSTEYKREIEQRLFQERAQKNKRKVSPLAIMLKLPSFEPEASLILNEEISHADATKSDASHLLPGAKKRYVLTVSRAKSSIWGELQRNSGKRKKEVQVERIDREISRELAIAIQRVWAKALHLTRYPSHRSSGLDGTKYVFTVWVHGFGFMEGETWSPEKGLPRELVDMGKSLMIFVEEDSQTKSTEKSLIEKLRRFEEAIPNPHES
jgi:hypothetical protein